MSTYHTRPKFSSGAILRNEYLVALELQSFDFPGLLFKGYGNGILSGCELSTTSDTVMMGPGVISYEGALYGIHEPISVKYLPTDETRYLKLYIGSNEGNSTCIVRRFSLKLSDKDTLGSGEFELCRFRLQPGAYLRCTYTDFRDRDTLYDTLNVIHSTYAALEGNGLSPAITKAYAEEVLRIAEIPALDAAVCINWLAQQYALPAKVILSYLKRCDCIDGETSDNQELYQGLLTRLEQLKEGGDMPQKNRRSGRRTILVD